LPMRQAAGKQASPRIRRQIGNSSLHDIDSDTGARILSCCRDGAGILIGCFDPHRESPLVLASDRDQVLPLSRRELGPILERECTLDPGGGRPAAIRAASMAMVPKPQKGSHKGSCPRNPAANSSAAASVSRNGALAWGPRQPRWSLRGGGCRPRPRSGVVGSWTGEVGARRRNFAYLSFPSDLLSEIESA